MPIVKMPVDIYSINGNGNETNRTGWRDSVRLTAWCLAAESAANQCMSLLTARYRHGTHSDLIDWLVYLYAGLATLPIFAEASRFWGPYYDCTTWQCKLPIFHTKVAKLFRRDPLSTVCLYVIAHSRSAATTAAAASAD